MQKHSHSLEQFDGLSSEAGKTSVQHERDQGDDCIHVGPDSPQKLVLMLLFKDQLLFSIALT